MYTAQISKTEQKFAEIKAEQVGAYVKAANVKSSHEARRMMDKFKLDFSFEKELGNGMASVGFYTDSSLCFKCCEIALPTKEWFR